MSAWKRWTALAAACATASAKLRPTDMASAQDAAIRSLLKQGADALDLLAAQHEVHRGERGEDFVGRGGALQHELAHGCHLRDRDGRRDGERPGEGRIGIARRLPFDIARVAAGLAAAG